MLIVTGSFADYVKIALASKQPPEVLRNPVNRKLIERLLPDILKGSMGRKVIPRFLPDLTSRIADNITAHRGSATDIERNAATSQACSIVGLSNAAWRLCFLSKTLKNEKKYAIARIDNETLCVAIGIDDHALIRSLLAAGVSMWNQCKLFGHTWEFAAKCDRFDTFKLLVSLTRMPTAGHRRAIHNNMMRNRMLALLQLPKQLCKNNEDCALELLKLGAAQFGNPTKGTSMQLFKAAYECGADKFISELLRLVPVDFADAWTGGIRCHVLRRSKEVEKRGTIVHHLLDRDIFSKDNINVSAFVDTDFSVYLAIPMSSKMRYRSLLDIAVSTHDLNLVNTVLDLGAHPDGAKRPGPSNVSGLNRGDDHIVYEKSYPLAFALLNNLTNIAEALLRAGASPTMGMTTARAAHFTMEHAEIGARVRVAILTGLQGWDSKMWSELKAR